MRHSHILSILLIYFLVVSGLSFAQPSWALTTGDLVKVEGQETVYYIGENGQRFVYPHRNVFLSWYEDFSQVQTVTLAEIINYPLSGNVTIRPGTNLIKIQSDPRVYAVSPGGILHYIDSEARAITLYGANWADKVVDVSDAFFSNYQVSTKIKKDEHPDGTLIQYESTNYIYLIQNGYKRSFKNLTVLADNGYLESNIITTTINYPDDIQIYGVEKKLNSPINTLLEDEPKENEDGEIEEPKVAQLFVSSDYTQLAANNTDKTIIKAILKDNQGVILTDYDKQVSFMSNIGKLSSTSTKPSAGIAQVIFTAEYITGTAEIIVSVGEVTKTIKINILSSDVLQPHSTMMKDPEFLIPEINSVASDEEYTISWGIIENIDYYIVQEDEDSNFGSPEEFQVTTNSFTTSHNVENIITYFYRVQGVLNTVKGFWNNTLDDEVVDMVIVGDGI